MSFNYLIFRAKNGRLQSPQHTKFNPNFKEYVNPNSLPSKDMVLSNPSLLLGRGGVHADYIQASHFAYPSQWLCSERFRELLELRDTPFSFHRYIGVEHHKGTKAYCEMRLDEKKCLPPDSILFDKSKFKLITQNGEQSISISSHEEFSARYPEIVNLKLRDDRVDSRDMLILKRFTHVFINETLKNDIISNKITGFEIYENHPDFDYSKRFRSDDFRVY